QFSTKNLSLDLYYTVTQLSSLLYNFPTEFRTIIRKIRRGNLNVNVELKGLENVSQALDTAANKITTSLIITALIIGSAISLNTSNNDKVIYFLGIPLISFIGFSAALLLSIYLLLYMLRKRK
ncbi:MAG: AarF/ABC1/UbiB kinase family protein, partial [Bacteroidota bacterium]